jgi:hypothetical protein
VDFLQRHFLWIFDEENLCSFLPVDAQCHFHIEPGLFDGFEYFQFLLTFALISLDDDCSSIDSVDVGLVFDEVLHSGFIIADEDGVVVLYELVSDLLIAVGLKKFIDFDMIDDVVIFSYEDDQRDEEVDRYD